MLPQWFKKQIFKIKKQAVILMRNESTHSYVTINVSTFIACATRGRCSGASFHLNLQCIKQRLLSNLLYRRAVMGGGGHYPGITRQRREQRHECCTHESLRSGPARWRRRRAAGVCGSGDGADSMADWPRNSRVEERTATFTLLHWSGDESHMLLYFMLLLITSSLI